MMAQLDNKRIAVMMAFDLDAETIQTTRGDGNHDHITNLSRSAYGSRQGISRILGMLDMYGIGATFFIPGVMAEHYPLVVRGISRRGHEIGFYGYPHEEPTATSHEEEDATMTRCEAIIEDLTGQSMAGHHGPSGVIHDYSLKLFLEHGYLYSSDWRDSDGPFTHTIDSRQIPLVKPPKDFIFDNAAYDFCTDSVPERYELKSPREILEVWKDGFDSLATEDRMVNFVLHPQFIERASRANMLSRLVGYMLSHGTWIGTNRAMAGYVLENRDLLRPDR